MSSRRATKPRRPAALALVTALGLALVTVLAGCGGGAPSSAAPTTASTEADVRLPAEPGLVKVMSRWFDGDESDALLALRHVLDHRYLARVGYKNMDGSGTWDQWVDPSRGLDALSTPVGRGGADDVALGRVQDVSGLYDDLGLAAVWPEGLYGQLALDGTLYALPCVVVRTNLLWSNPGVLADAGLDPDATYATVADWIAALHTLDDAGAQAIVVGAPWTQLLLLENLLVAEAGPRAARDLWDGRGDWGSSTVAKAIEDLDEILALANEDRDGLTETDLGRRVGAGKAAFTVMGGWLTEVLDERHRVAGVDYRVGVVPGTEGSFGFTADAFGWGATSAQPDLARAWLENASSSPGQAAVAGAMSKGVPVRTDADPTGLTALQRSTMADWRDDELVLSTVGGGPLTPGADLALLDEVAAFGDGKIGASALVAALVRASAPAASDVGGS